MIPLIAVFVLLTAASLLWVRPALEEILLNHSRAQIKDIVQIAWSIADQLQNEVASGNLSEADAKLQFLGIASNLRYGNRRTDYFWVNDTKGNLIIHPYSKTGNLIDYQDKEGKKVFREFNRITEENGEGYAEYFWRWKELEGTEELKTSYVMIFKPWNWIIGSGFYKRETLVEIRHLTTSFLASMLVFEIVLMGLIAWSIKTGLQNHFLLEKKEHLLKTNQQRISNMTSRLSQGILIIEGDEIVFYNERLCSILDFERTEIDTSQNRTFRDAVFQLVKACEEGDVVEYDKDSDIDIRVCWITTKSGKRKYIARRKNEDKSNHSVYQVFSDWTQRTQQNQQIQLLSKIVEECPLSVVTTDKEGTITYANRFASRSSGYSQSEIIGNNPRALKSSRVPAAVYKELWQTITSGNTWQGELLNKTKDGTLYWEYAIISPMLDANGEIESYYAIKSDITERKRIEEELRVAKEKAMESDRIKTSFLNNISHEIRTPLNAISGLVYIIEDELSHNHSIKEYREIILDNTQILLNLVDDILSVSELESSKAFANYEYWNIDEVLLDIVTDSENGKFSGKSNDVIIRTEFDTRLQEKVVFTDAVKIGTMIEELISNAIKFTNKGEIVVGYRLNNNQVEFFVSDTGAGISEEDKKSIFELFFHGKDHFVPLHGGTGLGLNIVKKIVRMMGGNIRFETEVGKGTTFYVSGICSHNSTSTF